MMIAERVSMRRYNSTLRGWGSGEAVRVAAEHLYPRTQPAFGRVVVLGAAPGHVQLEALVIQRQVLGSQATGGGQRCGGVVRHSGENVGAAEQGAEAVELRHGQ